MNRSAMRRRRQGQCLRKRPYPSEERAKKTAVRRWLMSGTQLRVYLCPHCGAWHLTSRVDMPTRRIGELGHEVTW